MSSAGIIAGRSPLSLLGVKGAGLGRRGGVPGAWPFMAAGAATASTGVYSQNQYLAASGRRCRGAGAERLPLALGAGALQNSSLRCTAGLLASDIARQLQSCLPGFLVSYSR